MNHPSRHRFLLLGAVASTLVGIMSAVQLSDRVRTVDILLLFATGAAAGASLVTALRTPGIPVRSGSGVGSPNKVVVAEALASITEHWRPQIVASLNGQEVKLALFRGDFVWHRHDDADELFLGVRGRFTVEFRDRAFVLGPGELLVVPRGAEHRTRAEEEAGALLFEPAGVRNTGDVEHPTLTAPMTTLPTNE